MVQVAMGLPMGLTQRLPVHDRKQAELGIQTHVSALLLLVNPNWEAIKDKGFVLGELSSEARVCACLCPHLPPSHPNPSAAFTGKQAKDSFQNG